MTPVNNSKPIPQSAPSSSTEIAPAWATDMPRTAPWRDEGASVVLDTPWLKLTEHRAVAPTGVEALYTVVRPKNLAAGVLPIHADGTVTLVGQSRFPLMNRTWEIPEGGVPEGEEPLAGIQRELAEEAGLKAGTWREVLRMELSNSFSDERAIAWLAWDLSQAPTDPDPTELIQTVRVPFTALITEIHRGAIRDAITVATALRAYHMAKEHLLPGWLAHAMLTRI